jgi:CheY-like chemotaxis protein
MICPNAVHSGKKRKHPRMARVLLADQNPTSRLTLKTVLEAGGYRVDSAATAAEAVGLMDEKEYALVLTDLAMESPEAGLRVLAHARIKDYQPATALVAAWRNEAESPAERASVPLAKMLVEPQGVPELLGQVAMLISRRATRLVARRMRRHALAAS